MLVHRDQNEEKRAPTVIQDALENAIKALLASAKNGRIPSDNVADFSSFWKFGQRVVTDMQDAAYGNHYGSDVTCALTFATRIFDMSKHEVGGVPVLYFNALKQLARDWEMRYERFNKGASPLMEDTVSAMVMSFYRV